MRFRFVSALVGLTLAGLCIASCTHDFDQFEPQSGQGDCPAGEKPCDESCVPVGDPSYGCGSGCEPCSLSNAIAACENGNCALDTCNTGFGDCDGVALNGCEVQTSTDVSNCGACNTLCTAPNAAGQCQAGACSVGQCNSGFANCDMDALNGCEAILSSDPKNCGACGNQCNSFQTCMGGDCKDNPCSAGTANCNGNTADGCETLLGTAQNCAFCNHACNLAHATEACVTGMCTVESCDAGWADCDMAAGNGCEVNIGTVTNCGACGVACPSGPNSTATCTGGVCSLNCTQSYFADCNGNAADGCEVDLRISTAHCGVCGHGCSGANSVGTACTNGECTPTCLNGYGDCTKPVAPMADDGCDTAIVDDVFNCGACGRVCSGTNTASRVCVGSTCTSTCDLGFANCDVPASGADDGCETNVQTSGFDCGGCGNDCSGNLVCVAGQLAQKQCGCAGNSACGSGGACVMGNCYCGGAPCGIGERCVSGACSCNGGASCGVGMLCCQTPAACVDPYADAANCGACGRACPAGFVCGGMPPAAPQCRCDGDADCNGGSTGTCNGNGTCQCGAMPCALGERCLSDGTCG